MIKPLKHGAFRKGKICKYKTIFSNKKIEVNFFCIFLFFYDFGNFYFLILIYIPIFAAKI